MLLHSTWRQDAQRLARKMNKGSGQSPKHWASSTAALIPMEYADLTTAEGERVELERDSIHYIPAELEEKANLDFWSSAKIPCPTFTLYFSRHYEEGAHWSIKKLWNLKATSPYLCWTVCSTLTNMAMLPQHQLPCCSLWFLLHLFLTLFASQYKRQPWNHPAVLSLWTHQFLHKWKAKACGIKFEKEKKQ